MLQMTAAGCPDPSDDDSSSPVSPSPSSPTPPPGEAGEIELSPELLDFGEVRIEEQATDTIIVRNVGSGFLEVSATFDVTDGFSLEASGPWTLEPGADVALVVVFTPLEARLYSVTLSVTSNDQTSPRVDVALSGRGVMGPTDDDGDGVSIEDGDCDDNDPLTYPGADEICDGGPDSPGIDNDCDGEIDEEGATSFYQDQDGDGFGDTSTEQVACAPAEGQVSQAGDCDDGETAIHPDAEEVCDGRDNDCDGELDEDVVLTFYVDQDGDGAGETSSTATGCVAPEGYVAEAGDCVDVDPITYPGADEPCDTRDNDCDGAVDEDVTSTFYTDEDGDGHGDPGASLEACAEPLGTTAAGDDCDDGDVSNFPGNLETCDGRDNDCDFEADEDVMETFFLDRDEDGFGDPAVTYSACEAPPGFVADGNDCNDRDRNVYPNAPESCDGKDNDCDELVDEDGETIFYEDSDGDGYGWSAETGTGETWVGCSAPEGFVSSADDCDDRNAGVHPNALEVCDGQDQDCDGAVDEEVQTSYFHDGDGDGFGAGAPTAACAPPDSSWVTGDGDCNDGDGTVFPGAPEPCNGVDDDCDGETDEEALETFYQDADGDGYGDSVSSLEACATPEGYASEATDCDDIDPDVHPGALEVCDSRPGTPGRDEDCDGLVDEGVKTTFYLDSDGDGVGISSATIQACVVPDGYSEQAGDCDDSDPDRAPGVTETCDGRDNDCDTAIDEEVKTAWYFDGDGDGYGKDASMVLACSAPSSWYIAQGGDCNDSSPGVHPDAEDVCNDVDDDCDGEVDEEGAFQTFYPDQDGDGFGDSDAPLEACRPPAGYVSVGGDCDDLDPDIVPGGVGCAFDVEGESCAAIAAAGDSRGDGYYMVDPGGPGGTYEPMEVYCDMTTGGVGWTRVFSLNLGTGCTMDAGATAQDPANPGQSCAKYSDTVINLLAQEKVFYSQLDAQAPLFTKYADQITANGPPGKVIQSQDFPAIRSATPTYTVGYGAWVLFHQQNWYQSDRCLGAPPASYRLSIEYVSGGATCSGCQKYMCTGACNADCPSHIYSGHVEVFIR